MMDSTISFNVIGEIRGSQFPNEYIVIGGHLDSWDVGEGAHDDGTGVVQSIEALRLFKAAGIKPKRSLRAIAFANEENGLRGGVEYDRMANAKNEIQVAAMESDAGGFLPMGFNMSMEQDKKEKVRRWRSLFLPYGLWSFEREGSGADISPMVKRGVPGFGLYVSSQRYFNFHHNTKDVFEDVDPRELQLGAAAMAALAYMISEYGL
jgi:hypothetical protein